jgi:hypothetical protein
MLNVAMWSFVVPLDWPEKTATGNCSWSLCPTVGEEYKSFIEQAQVANTSSNHYWQQIYIWWITYMANI